MSQEVLLGLLLGGGLGLAHTGASFLLYRAARKRKAATFNRMVLGGMVVRLALVLVAVVLVLWLAPVHVFAFLASLMGAFVMGTVFEISYVVRRPARSES